MHDPSEKRHDTPRAAGPTTEASDDLDLDLPALDGDGGDGDGDEAPVDDFDLDEGEDGGDPFDDATGEGGPVEELAASGEEGGWLEDADSAAALDVGPFDMAFDAEERLLEDDEPDDAQGLSFELAAEDEGSIVADGGEEGPLAEDEELRAEDLPALDADDEGDVPDEQLLAEQLFDPRALGGDDELRWDDRAWARATTPPAASDEADDSGVLTAPGEDLAQSSRDAVWRRFEESGRAMAAAVVPGDSVVVAVSTADRGSVLLVRIQPDGEARIVAEIDPRLPQSARGALGAPPSSRAGAAGDEDEDEPCRVTFMRWDAARGVLFVGGSFGVEAYRPI